MKAAIYARVSTEDQNNQMQLTELREYAQRMGWTVVEYLEKESSVRRRPVFEQMMQDARQRRFDYVLTWKVDRLCRSMKQLIDTVLTLDQYGIPYRAITQNCCSDQKDPMGKFVLALFGILAEFERDMLVDRVRSGVAQYKKDHAAGRVGTHRHSWSKKDLPIGRPKTVFRRDLAREMRARGDSWRKIAAALGVAQSVVRLALKGQQ